MPPSPPGLESHPLFPLGTVLFPDGPLPLRIFEPRYLDMVSACLRGDGRFGVCLIREGREVGPAARPFEIGTLARIVDWHQYDDGVLGITALGESRFRVHESRVEANQLLVGSCERLAEAQVETPAEAGDLVELSARLMDRLGQAYATLPRRPQDAGWLGYRLSELLPLPMTRRQHLLALDDPLERLAEIRSVLRLIEASQSGRSSS